ncbi:MAG: peptidoglycan bridge formation glycyltransferase FemA/FemB family protein [Nitrospirae bacterium]|nr:MAG: peptidoglycan bridge formation glycyltransferase FemA/FemB family protein [Nitrospirota bacterium]
MAFEMTILSDDEATRCWDDWVTGFRTPAFLQGHLWGEYKRALGWRPVRCLFRSGDTVWGGAQCLIKEIRRPRVTVIWVPGGPLLREPRWQELREALARQFTGSRLYLRIDPMLVTRAEQVAQELTASGWKLSPARLNNGCTILFSLEEAEDKWRSRLTGNWRHNLVRGEARASTVERWEGRDPEALFELYRAMAEYKGFTLNISKAELRGMLSAFGHRMILVVSRNRGGQIVAARAGGWLGPYGYDLFAATSMEGRKSYASYVVLWRLLQELKQRGVLIYDLGGVDRDNNPGVFHFKHGMGNAVVQRPGEWEWSNSPALSWGVNQWVRFRMRTMI